MDQNKIKYSLRKLSKELVTNPPSHFESFKENILKIFIQTYDDTCHLLQEGKNNLQVIGSACAASQELGAINHFTSAENIFKNLDDPLDDIGDKIEHLISPESADTYPEKFDETVALMNVVQNQLESAFLELKQILIK